VFISDQGCLLRQADSGEHHVLLVLFLRGHGLRHALARRRSRPDAGQQLPGLFETADFTLEQKDPSRPVFLRECAPLRRFPGIGRGYPFLQAAAAVARLYERNLVHMEHFGAAWDLLQKALAAVSEKPRPDLTLLKTTFLLARAEGYPVGERWLAERPAAERAALLRALHEPLATAAAGPAEVEAWTRDLFRFLARETDLLPPAD